MIFRASMIDPTTQVEPFHPHRRERTASIPGYNRDREPSCVRKCWFSDPVCFSLGKGRELAFAIKAEMSDLDPRKFRFCEQKTMYGGKAIAAGDIIFLFASEREGGCALVGRGIVISALTVPKTAGIARQTPRMTITADQIVPARRSFGKRELQGDLEKGTPQAELHFKFYRQATNKIVGLTQTASIFLDGFFDIPSGASG